MARALYTLLGWLLLPFLPMRLWWRGRREPGYRERIGERFGFYRDDVPRLAGDVVWIHAVSLGETRAAAPLIERLSRELPKAKLLLTHMTATGREAGRALYGDRVVQAWLPYDTPFAIRAFLTRFRPRIGLLMETELWPNLVVACRAAGVPTYLVNARLSAASASGYARFPSLSRPLFAALAGAAAQTDDDAERLRALGANDVAVIGNLKFDIEVSAASRADGRALRDRIGTARPVFIAASTRDGEEALLLDALGSGEALPEGTLTIIVPRHPQRFDAVAALLAARGIDSVRKSSSAAVTAATRVLLGDTIGEMFAYYASADVAFVGGSLLPLGGQNLIEPIAVGVPTLVGPHTFNFAEASERAIDAGAALRVADAPTLVATVASLLRDDPARSAMSRQAQAFCAAHRGAAGRLWAWLAPRIGRDDSDISRSGAD
ncbi:MAG TPA: lipid IV(A) 3-deoxy-D-manno-octulosonic acid transferase [Casimicrobiaceae bacterium]|nr:lipid IV(A) 3-deoxy-D-manno-octulosonic acid transferase [Casimicrobiaceae bacterium]